MPPTVERKPGTSWQLAAIALLTIPMIVGGVWILCSGAKPPPPPLPSAARSNAALPSALPHRLTWVPEDSAKALPLAPAQAPHIDEAWMEQVAQRQLERVRKTVVFSNGMTASAHPSHVRHEAGRAVEYQLELKDKDGKPVGGRGAIELIVSEDRQPPHKAVFIEDVTHPGRYQASIIPENSGAKRIDVTAIVSETDNVEDPKVQSIGVSVESAAQVSLRGLARGVPGQNWISVGVAVSSQVEAPAAIRAMLATSSGRKLGEALGLGQLVPGQNEVVIDFPEVVLTPEELRSLVLIDTALFTGSPFKFGDAWAQPMDVTVIKPRP